MNYLKPEITVYVNWLVSAQFIKQQIGKISYSETHWVGNRHQIMNQIYGTVKKKPCMT